MNKWDELISRWLGKSVMFKREQIPLKEAADSYEVHYVNEISGSKIEIGFLLEEDRLVFLHFINPKTPGLTHFYRSDIQYFEEGVFEDPPEFGEVGLKFSDLNISKIKQYFVDGVRGTETQYSDGDVLLASKVKLEEFGDPPHWYQPVTGFFRRIKILWKNEEEKYYEGAASRIDVVQLDELFPGIKIDGN